MGVLIQDPNGRLLEVPFGYSWRSADNLVTFTARDGSDGPYIAAQRTDPIAATTVTAIAAAAISIIGGIGRKLASAKDSFQRQMWRVRELAPIYWPTQPITARYGTGGRILAAEVVNAGNQAYLVAHRHRTGRQRDNKLRDQRRKYIDHKWPKYGIWLSIGGEQWILTTDKHFEVPGGIDGVNFMTSAPAEWVIGDFAPFPGVLDPDKTSDWRG